MTARLEPAAAQPRTGKQIALAIAKWGAIGGLAFTALFAAVIAIMFWHYARDPNLPGTQSLRDYQPKQVTRIVTGDGNVIGEIFTERRTYVSYEEIPELLVHAVISAEDANFFEHEGLDYWGMVRALFVNVKSGKKRQGASTITQQVVKTFLLSPERTFRRKFQEIILARRIEDELSKEEILTLYLNQIYFGGGRYGVQEASRYYFGKDVMELNAGEAALIAGLPQSPERISPKKKGNQERAKRRQTYVLEQMAYHRYITEQDAKKWIDEPIRIVGDPYPHLGSAPEWVDLIRQKLIAEHGDDGLDKLGGTIVANVDLSVQEIATDALRTGLRELDARRKYGRAIRKVRPDKIDLEAAKLGRKFPSDGPKPGKRYNAIIRGVYDQDQELVADLGGWKASVKLGGESDERYNPDGKHPGERFAVGDVIKVVAADGATSEHKDNAAEPKHSKRWVALAPGPEGAVVVIEPRTRKVLALVGGYHSVVAGFNRATMAKRQAGSTFKPFVYAAAIDSGDFTAASIVNDAPEVYDLWKPQNYKKGKFAGPVRLRYALAKSINTVSIRVTHDVGPERVADLARSMGIRDELPKTLSLALGSGEVKPIDLTNAFATFAAGGKYAEPQFIASIGGVTVPAPVQTEALRPETSYIVTDMMRSVVTSGTGARANKLHMNIAGKTGTSNDARDAWFVGMTPTLVVGVWVGFDHNQSLGRGEGGSRSALPVFVHLMKGLRKRSPIRAAKFPRPHGVEEARIDKPTGLLAPVGAKKDSIYTEVFLVGSAPTEAAPAPGEADATTFVLDSYEDEGEDGADDEADRPPGSTTDGQP